jgi:hypothetical protein
VSSFGLLLSYGHLKLRTKLMIIENKWNKIINQHNTEYFGSINVRKFYEIVFNWQWPVLKAGIHVGHMAWRVTNWMLRLKRSTQEWKRGIKVCLSSVDCDETTWFGIESCKLANICGAHSFWCYRPLFSYFTNSWLLSRNTLNVLDCYI